MEIEALTSDCATTRSTPVSVLGPIDPTWVSLTSVQVLCFDRIQRNCRKTESHEETASWQSARETLDGGLTWFNALKKKCQISEDLWTSRHAFFVHIRSTMESLDSWTHKSYDLIISSILAMPLISTPQLGMVSGIMPTISVTLQVAELIFVRQFTGKPYGKLTIARAPFSKSSLYSSKDWGLMSEYPTTDRNVAN